MAHPWYHAVMAARKFGGVSEDYLPVETWMDFTKSHIADCRHRLFLHNAWGLFVAERILGATITRASDGKTLAAAPAARRPYLAGLRQNPDAGAVSRPTHTRAFEGELGLPSSCIARRSASAARRRIIRR